MNQKKVEETISKLLADVAELKVKNTDLNKRVKELEEGSIGTGVYLEGCPDYAKEYITEKKKEGE